ncbi:MAG: hypothetical protein CVV37_07355, partial [Nitrospira bacterium HGW-Nitrospira-1]
LGTGVFTMSFPAILPPSKKRQSNILKSGHFYFGMTPGNSSLDKNIRISHSLTHPVKLIQEI